MKHVDYKALGSLPGAHETLIPFKQHVNTFFSLLCNGEKKRMPYDNEAPGGYKGGGEGCGENRRF
jgi:hypothetical protein